MKLYKEEQVKKAISIAEYQDYEYEQIIDELTPIELPSDDDIKDKSFNKFTQSNARTCFEEGAKWIKEQMLNQNKS